MQTRCSADFVPFVGEYIPIVRNKVLGFYQCDIQSCRNCCRVPIIKKHIFIEVSHFCIFHVQVLINQLKEIAPTLQKSISECSEKVIYIASNLPPMNKHHGQLTSPIQGQSSGRMVINRGLFALQFISTSDLDEMMPCFLLF